MPIITLPDGSTRTYPAPLTVADVAADIGPGLAKAALAGRIAGQLVDTSHMIDQDVELAIITERDADGLEVIRHSAAHLLAMAVQNLFPTAQVTIGPVIDDGFFYDFAFERPFTLDDLASIEQKMTEIAAGDLPVNRVVVSRDEAIRMFEALGESYKVQIIRELPEGDEISIYKQGEWMDLCRGPHVPSTAKLKAFKLTKVSGAYWRGDSQNEMLQRIYGTAWPDQKQLKAYLMRIEEAEKRDHRKIGKRLDLFHLQEEAPGMVFWHPRGWAIYTVIEAYMRQLQRKHGYKEIRTPLVMDRVLWEKSGHWQNYAENMFTTASESRDYAVKPMNCPGHVQVFNQGLKSYRDLPLRLAEFGCCHRNEPSGSLHGIMRIRGFTQDDAHIFCTDDDVQAEAAAFIALTQQVYADFGFADVQMKLSTRPAKRVGADELWDKAEYALESALKAAGLEYELQPGEGAFYGPKIEFSLKDCIGRVWQCGTLQLDFNLPERLGASYVTEDNNRKPVAMLHRAVLGSFERFIGILIENYEGAFPVWLSPVQVVVMNITDQQAGYVSKVEDFLQNQGFRVESDLRNEKIGFKIREHTIQRIPYLLVIGDREAQTNTVAVRARGGEELGSMTLDAFADFLTTEIAKRGRIF